MFNRRGFLKLTAGAIAGLLAGKVVPVTEPSVATEAAAESAEGFTGEIENVRIFDRALTLTEVAQYYAQGRSNPANPLSEGLVAFWSGTQRAITICSPAYVICCTSGQCSQKLQAGGSVRSTS